MTCKGYNPMRHDCGEDGCFNVVRRPKLEVFASCFPGRINFGDVDGRVELNWRFLELEWKKRAGRIPTGQRIAFERLTSSCPVTVFVVAGDAETMTVEKFATFYKGQFSGWRDATLIDVKEKMQSWAEWAQKEWAA